MNDEEKIEKLTKAVDALIEKYVKSERKAQIIKMFEEIGDLYFTAPASSRTQYHSAFPGGLVEHSINVLKNLLQLNQTFKYGFSEESMVICALFHDLGKACAVNLKDPHYTPSEGKWKEERGILYDYNDAPGFMTNHLRSLFVLQSFGISLNYEEYLAVYLNDGQYLQENRPYALKEPKLALMLHFADRLALEQERKD